MPKVHRHHGPPLEYRDLVRMGTMGPLQICGGLLGTGQIEKIVVELMFALGARHVSSSISVTCFVDAAYTNEVNQRSR